ncbi:hypothetical protein L596_006228 [Steinernema carpocapsae]|uniref:Uncharacterized protein n=1 Tax=Steinernema carpocapsae TaxID=34508 RepID=A0A4U8V7D0_STECR|nr:hypothetical protein L596_006228 [Steinernema carpocapsae]
MVFISKQALINFYSKNTFQGLYYWFSFRVSFTDDGGTFQLDGCGDDFDWIPGVPNDPEPYIQILHYCNNDKGEIMLLPEFNTFVPNTYEIGTIELDAPEVELAPLNARNATFGRGSRRS